MRTFICEICGDAYLGTEAPSKCPFCGADHSYIKPGAEANPVFKRAGEIGEKSKENLMLTLDLEMKASAIYLCMAGKTEKFEIKQMYKRLAKVELEHATVVTKLLGIEMPKSSVEECGDEDLENFEKTVELEEHATSLYGRFAAESEEEKVKTFFVALMKVEAEHIELIRNYM
ncbi:MAG: ferritin family protein [Candidatus Moranbacteria bacterium]|jgi:rubrerythrin|nr:ferritin family protein [Candidatus Moranbacteria bacterium]MDD5652475.1 ferritin family protein [Candidatus Moranbacteria bacterium]MDX9855401.1 ferritin family protein [Candidatus Moranbacteria bacterium]